MGKERHNVNTIAEILLQKLNDLDRLAKRIEEATKKSVPIDTTPLLEVQEEQSRILSGFQRLAKEQDKYIPKSLLYVFITLVLMLVGSLFMNYTQRNEINVLKQWKQSVTEQHQKQKR